MSEGTTGEMVSAAGRVDLRAVKAAYERGENITKLLRDACKNELSVNELEAIEIVYELLQVTRRKLVLFEPSFEDNSAEGQQRMRELGYIRELDMHIKDVGAVLVDKIAMHNISNPLNPTFCYVIQKVGSSNHSHIASTRFTCPISGEVLEERDDYLWSAAGYAYPKINGMPLLREKDAILMCYE